MVVALDLTIDDGLRQRGYVRDLVRQVQEMRRAANFDVSDRITLFVVGVDDLADFFGTIAAEVLATEILSESGPGEGTALEFDDARVAHAWVRRAG